ncbi:MAG TPA: UbiX family flavin prenyltransferase [Ferruginibacter sp.]|nr:UbiX family flavin prenyltransferase [Bacteroidota bacterium]MBS1926223.1 UbiX family flavin prenyltransferase [Bacteroidota bacterium]MCC6692692.1 UbiX family flavin prenyltransferase [Chitinophagaceae bacterium]HMT96022.1 UbiX family flavin prenyltransferase [Ferruginibacter sp.]HMU25640.1 UbiX family flavin prenyltransferase [Ferruginibacter sp.]
MQKIVIAITGASGSVYSRQLLTKLQQLHQYINEVSVVVTENAKQVWETELGENFTVPEGTRSFSNTDFTAPFASGSGQYQTMIICPCSMGTLGRIAAGTSNDLITRSADVILKERRKLICVVRETPYNLIHIRNMETVTLAGGIICPATPSFYSQPETIEALAATVVDRVLDLAGLPVTTYRWGN